MQQEEVRCRDHRSAVDANRRPSIVDVADERDFLEVRSVLAGRSETEPAEFRFDVACRGIVPGRAGLAAERRVVGDDRDARPEVCCGDAPVVEGDRPFLAGAAWGSSSAGNSRSAVAGAKIIWRSARRS